MKRYLLFLFIMVMVIIPLMGQNVRKKYISYSSEAGTIYFIQPLKNFKSNELKSKLEYDITYLSSTDSLTFNFSFYSMRPSPVDSIGFNPSGEISRIILPSKMLFIEPFKKNKWKHRVSVRVPVDYFQKLYGVSSPYQIIIYSPSDNYTFYVNDKDWNNEKDVISKIFDIIRYNGN